MYITNIGALYDYKCTQSLWALFSTIVRLSYTRASYKRIPETSMAVSHFTRKSTTSRADFMCGVSFSAKTCTYVQFFYMYM